MAFSSYFRPLDLSKTQFYEVEKAMIQVVKCHLEVNFLFLTNRNCDFFHVDKATIQVENVTLNSLVEVGKAMFQVLAWHTQLILDLWISPKCGLDEAEKAMIQVVEIHFEVIFCILTNRNCDLFQGDKETIQVSEWQLKVIFCLLTSPKFDFGVVRTGHS